MINILVEKCRMTYFYLSEKHVDQMMTPSIASGCQQDSKNSSDYHEIPVQICAGRPFPVFEEDKEEPHYRKCMVY